jgi:hypothetical protein
MRWDLQDVSTLVLSQGLDDRLTVIAWAKAVFET